MSVPARADDVEHRAVGAFHVVHVRAHDRDERRDLFRCFAFGPQKHEERRDLGRVDAPGRDSLGGPRGVRGRQVLAGDQTVDEGLHHAFRVVVRLGPLGRGRRRARRHGQIENTHTHTLSSQYIILYGFIVLFFLSTVFLGLNECIYRSMIYNLVN
jgi:hypothetical protein